MTPKIKARKSRSLISLIFFMFTALSFTAKAQKAILTAGGNDSTAIYSVSYSIGQLLYMTNNGVLGSEAQGVQQPFEISTVSGVGVINNIVLQAVVYPNPVQSVLKLRIEKPQGLSYQLFDMYGKLLEMKKITDSPVDIDVSRLNPAIYFLKVTDGKTIIKIFKIVKN